MLDPPSASGLADRLHAVFDDVASQDVDRLLVCPLDPSGPDQTPEALPFSVAHPLRGPKLSTLRDDLA